MTMTKVCSINCLPVIKEKQLGYDSLELKKRVWKGDLSFFWHFLTGNESIQSWKTAIDTLAGESFDLLSCQCLRLSVEKSSWERWWGVSHWSTFWFSLRCGSTWDSGVTRGAIRGLPLTIVLFLIHEVARFWTLIGQIITMISMNESNWMCL